MTMHRTYPSFFYCTLLMTCIGVVLAGCDTTSNEVEPEIIVESYQVAGQPLAQVRLTRTVAIDDAFDPEAQAVQGATVVVERLDEGGAVAQRYPYEPSGTPGVYVPLDAEPVEPLATYRLTVNAPDQAAPITAETTVPGDFELVELENTTTVFQEGAQPAFTVTRSSIPGRRVVFIFSITSQLDFENTAPEELEDELTLFYADAFDDDDDQIEDFRVNSSPLLNEANYDVNPDGTLTVRVPWIAIAFYGPNEASINVVDANLFDFIRTEEAQQGGLAPGEIPNVLDHVTGGTGVFGSYARLARDITILRDESP